MNKIDDRIEREILIEAPLERVWQFAARPGFWLADGTDEAVVGESAVVRSAEYGEFPVRAEKIEPPVHAVYRWVSAFADDEVRQDNSTLVEFTLVPDGANTRLRVVETGFAALAGSDELRRGAFQDNAEGWPAVLDALKKRVERTSP